MARDYSALTIRKGDAFGNAIAVAEFEHRRRYTRVGTKTDRSEWSATPQTVNAFSNVVFNEITIPAGYLGTLVRQPHFEIWSRSCWLKAAA